MSLCAVCWVFFVPIHGWERRQNDDPIGSRRLANPDFPNIGADRFDRLPVVGIVTQLNLIQLISRLRSRIVRKRPQPCKAIAKKQYRLNNPIRIEIDTYGQATHF